MIYGKLESYPGKSHGSVPPPRNDERFLIHEFVFPRREWAKKANAHCGDEEGGTDKAPRSCCSTGASNMTPTNQNVKDVVMSSSADGPMA